MLCNLCAHILTVVSLIGLNKAVSIRKQYAYLSATVCEGAPMAKGQQGTERGIPGLQQIQSYICYMDVLTFMAPVTAKAFRAGRCCHIVSSKEVTMLSVTYFPVR